MTVQTKGKNIVPRKVKYDQDYIKRSRGEKLFTVCNYTFMVLLLVFLLYPVLNVIAISMSSETEVMAANVTFYPIGFNPQAYKTIFRDGELWHSIFNSFVVSFGGCALSLVALCVAAYPLAFGKFYGKKLYYVIIMFTMWFQGGIVPLFLTIQNLGSASTASCSFSSLRRPNIIPFFILCPKMTVEGSSREARLCESMKILPAYKGSPPIVLFR